MIFPITFSSFNPKQVSGLVCWLDSSDTSGNGTTPVNGTAISSIIDKSGNNNLVSQAIGALQPIFNANQFKGLGSIFYNGSSQYLSGTVLSNTLHTVFISYKASSLTPQNTVFYNGSSGTSGYGYVVQTGNVRAILFGGITYKTNGSATTNLEQTTMSWNGTISVLRINGSQQTITSPTSAPNSPPIGALQLGKDSGSAYWNGYINEVLVYNTATLNSSDIVANENYLINKW